MRIRVPAGAIGAVVLAALSGCGTRAVLVPPVVSESGECEVLWPVEEPGDTIRVALLDAVDARNAPRWSNEAERLVFNHLYETLLGTECEDGGRRSGLAETITFEARRARLKIRGGARFWDGTPVTAFDVVECLRDAWRGSAIDSAVAIDEGEIVLYAARSDIDWSILCSPSFFVARITAGPWPMGTGRYRVADRGRGTGLLLEPAGADAPLLEFVDCRGSDPRDLLDAAPKRAVDLMVVVYSEDIVTYAQRSDRLKAMRSTNPTRAYVLMAPARALASRRGQRTLDLPESFCDALAHDAVRAAYATPIREPGWWDADTAHETSLLASSDDLATERSVVFDASDPTARDLAERIVALAATGASSSPHVVALGAAVPGIVDRTRPVVAVGADRAELSRRLWRGADVAYIVALPFDTPDHHRGAADLRRSAPWLADVALKECLLPLVSTHQLAIVMNRRIGVTSDRFGSLFITGSAGGTTP